MGMAGSAFLEEIFGVGLANELFATGANGEKRHSESVVVEKALAVQLPGCDGLYQSLERYIAGEQVEYKWEKKNMGGGGNDAGETLPTTKRVSIKTLPNVLIFQLKRFDFDFNTFMQVKLNDHYEFPDLLDMFPYTKEGRPDGAPGGGGGGAAEAEDGAAEDGAAAARPPEYYQYRLSGIVVHMGTTTSGHYYSYVRERSDSGKWFEFNDKYVTAPLPSYNNNNYYYYYYYY